MIDRLLRLADADDEWHRPLPAGWLRTDAIGAALALAISVVAMELLRSGGALGSTTQPLWAQYAAVVSVAALLVVRRRWPIAVGVAAVGHLLVVGTLMPVVTAQLSLQVLYFVAVYSAVAWARDRRALAAAVAVTSVAITLWGVWYFALGRGIQEVVDSHSAIAHPSDGLLGPVTANLLLFALVNICYFGGAAALGVSAHRSARTTALVAEQAHTIEHQAAELRDRAVLDERLRIARELHDVVAHHVAAIGVQAGAARRVLPPDADRAAEALRTVEGSSREAVTEMRGLLGTLRERPGSDGSDPADHSPDRLAGPGLADLPALVDGASARGFSARLDHALDPALAPGDVPPSVGLSLYRTVQEALANVRRHSTARSARVTLRTGTTPGRWAEVEILDDGRPRTGTSGSGVGLLGMRERVASHHGTCEIGPRVTGGYRVRVRLPLDRPQETP